MPTQLRAGRESILLDLLPWFIWIAQIVTATCFVINLFYMLPQFYIWSMLNTLQIYVHMLLIEVNLPANAYLFLHALLEPAKLRIFPTHDLFERWFGLAPNEDDTISFYFLEANYDSAHMYYLAAHVYFDAAVLIIFTILAICVYQFIAVPCKLTKAKDAKRKVMTIFAQGVTVLLLIGAMELMLCAMITFYKNGSASSSAYSTLMAVTAVIIMALLPFFIVYTNFTHDEDLKHIDSEIFKWKYGVLWYNFKQNSGLAPKMYWNVFLARRFAICVILIFLRHMPWL